jgi:surfactin synthase thioesterase subunit
LLRSNWQKLQPQLDSKIRISVGNQDNFFLNYAVELLEKEMKNLEAKVEFAYCPGDHFTIETEEYRKAGHSFLEKKYREWLENAAR